MKIKTPSIRELQKHLTSLKCEIMDDYYDWEEAREAERYGEKPRPYIELTLACDETGYALQIGDNSYSGSAYFYKHWGVNRLYRDSNCTELARDLIEQCHELAAQREEN